MAEANYQLALLMHEQGEWDLASAHYQAVATAMPDCSPKVYYNWGLLNHQCGRYSLAAACYHHAIAIQPEYLKPHLKLADVIQQQEALRQVQSSEKNGDNTNNILEFHEDLLASFPHVAVVHNQIGQLWHKQKQLDSALHHYEKALQINPKLAKVHHNLATLWSEQKHDLRAMEHYAKAAKYQATPATLGNWCKFYLQQGDFSSFLRILRKAIAISPKYINAYCDQFLSTGSNDYLAQVRHACAHLLKCLQEDLKDDKLPTALHYLFEIYIHSGTIAYEARNFQRAEQNYHRAIAINPKAAEVQDYLTNCLMHQNRMAAAIAIHALNRTNDSKTAPPPFKASNQPAPPDASQLQSTNSEQSCSVTCASCMGELIQAFRPEALAKGLYQVRFEDPPSFPVQRDRVEYLSKGQAWVSPKKSDWAACHEVIVSNAKGKTVDKICRQYPWRLPNCSKPPIKPSFQPSEYPKVHHLKGKTVLLSSLSGHVYYHWMIDLLPRLGILQSEGVDLESVDWFVVNSIQSSFQRETLMHLGLPMDKVIESDCYPHIQANQLIVPSFPGHLDWVPKRTINFLRSHFLNKNPTFSEKPESDQAPKHQPALKRIYISRKHAQYRNVLNESEIEAILIPLGFRTVHLEKMTVLEQAQMFAQAEIIISPHGSGLTNLVFCQPNTTVIELFAPRYLRTDYWMVSQLLKLNHYYILGHYNTCAPLRDLMFQSALTEDIYIELASIRSAIRINQIQ